MSTLQELSVIAQSENLNEMMAIRFDLENERDIQIANRISAIAEELSGRVTERDLLIGELANVAGSITAIDSARMLSEMSDSNLAQLRSLMAWVNHIHIKVLKKMGFVCQLLGK